MGYSIKISMWPSLPCPFVKRNPNRLTGNGIRLEYKTGHQDVLQNSRVIIAVKPLYFHSFLFPQPAFHLCRFRVPGIGVIKESNTIVSVHCIEEDISLTFFIREITGLSKYHFLSGFVTFTRFVHHLKGLCIIISFRHTELHLCKSGQFPFFIFCRKES